MLNNYTQKVSSKIVDKLIGVGMVISKDTGVTFGEVFDWFKNNKGIVITLEPFFSYTFKSHIAYTWKITYIEKRKDCEFLKEITEQDYYRFNQKDGYGGSFPASASAAIKYSIILIEKSNEEIK